MKKLISFALTLAMVMALTVPAFAAGTAPAQYVQPIMDYRYDETADDSVLTEVGSVTFDAATTEEKTVSIEAPWDYYEDTITIIRVKPGILMTVSGEDIKANSFCILDGTKLEVPVSFTEYLKTDEFDGTLTTGTVDRVFAQFTKPACLVLTPDGSEKMVILALDGSATPTEPTQPTEPETPTQPSQPAMPAANTAYASTQTVNVDGKAVTFECYALKEGNGMTNYIKLRDLAMHLNGTAAQFQVGWDGSVTITTKTAYTPNGSELSTPYSGDRTYQETSAATKVNGQDAQLAAFVLNDDNGGGYTYYQLRDLGKALGFNVGWSADKGIFVETDKPYDPAN